MNFLHATANSIRFFGKVGGGTHGTMTKPEELVNGVK
jgi:hypothetical protein